MKNKKKNSDDISVFLESLESKKSERTTLKLTEKAIEGLAYLKDWHQLTVKVLIDGMYTMYASIGDEDAKYLGGYFDISSIEEIIRKRKERPKQLCTMPRKTYVLSKGAIRVFSTLSNKFTVSRDDLISDMIEDWADSCRGVDEELRESYRKGYKILSEYEAYTKDVHLKFNKITGFDFNLLNKHVTPDIDVLCNSTASQIAKLKEKLEKLIKDKK